MKKTLFVVVFTAVFACVYGGNTTTVPYLLVDSYPELAAIGPACGAASYGIASLDANPAAIAGIDNISFDAMRAYFPAYISAERASAAKVFDFGAIAMGFTYFDLGAFDTVGIDSNLAPVLTSAVTGGYAAYGSLAYAKKIEGLSIGLAIKIIDEFLGINNYIAAAFDAGFIVDGLFTDQLDFGASLLNVSKEENGFMAPLDLKACLSYDIRTKMRDVVKLFLAADYLIKEDSIKGFLGADYLVFDELSLKAGLNLGNREKLSFTAGFGVTIGNISVNYAYLPGPDLGDSHKISISGAFGKQVENVDKPDTKGGESFEEYRKSGDFYYENKQYRQALKYYEYINLLYWKELEILSDKIKSAFFQKLGICYYNIRDNKRAQQYFERALYFEKDNEILKHWIKLLK